jgi:hypothetical protein
LDSPKGDGTKICQLFYAYRHMMTSFHKQIKGLYAKRDVAIIESKRKKRRLLLSYLRQSVIPDLDQSETQSDLRNQLLCRQPVRLYNSCNMNVFALTKSFIKDANQPIINIEDYAVQAIKVPRGCRVRVYSHIMNTEGATLLSHNSNSHSIVMKGPISMCLALKMKHVAAVELTDAIETSILVDDILKLEKEVGRLQKTSKIGLHLNKQDKENTMDSKLNILTKQVSANEKKIQMQDESIKKLLKQQKKEI